MRRENLKFQDCLRLVKWSSIEWLVTPQYEKQSKMYSAVKDIFIGTTHESTSLQVEARDMPLPSHQA